MTAETKLQAHAIRLIKACDEDEPVRLEGGDLDFAEHLAARGYLELLPGCTATFQPTEKGRKAVEEAGK